jgi:hypothetical protein
MTDRPIRGRNIDDALDRLYKSWNENVSVPPFTFMNVREQLGEQERPSLLSQVSVQIGRLTAKWRFPVTKSQIGSITTAGAIIVIIALYIVLIGPSANDAEEVVPAVEPTVTPAPEPTNTTAPEPTPTRIPEPTPTSLPEPTATSQPAVLPESKIFPSELEDSAAEISEEAVLAAWTEYLSNVQILGDHPADLVMTLCGDGIGRFVTDGVRTAQSGDITWEVRKSGSNWNAAVLYTVSPDPDGDPPTIVPFTVERIDGVTKVREYTSVSIIEHDC